MPEGLMPESRVREIKKKEFHDWEKLSDDSHRHCLRLQDIKRETANTLSKVYFLLEHDFGLTEDKLLNVEKIQLQKCAEDRAKRNARLSKELQDGFISVGAFDENIIRAPDFEVLNDFYTSYGLAVPVKFINGLTIEEQGKYHKSYLRPKLLQARRDQIKPFLDDSNDVLK